MCPEVNYGWSASNEAEDLKKRFDALEKDFNTALEEIIYGLSAIRERLENIERQVAKY